MRTTWHGSGPARETWGNSGPTRETWASNAVAQQPNFNQQNRAGLNQKQRRPTFNQNQQRPNFNENQRQPQRGYGEQGTRGQANSAFGNYGQGGNARVNSARGQQSLEGAEAEALNEVVAALVPEAEAAGVRLVCRNDKDDKDEIDNGRNRDFAARPSNVADNSPASTSRHSVRTVCHDFSYSCRRAAGQ